MTSARAFASSVLPTPVVPKKMNVPEGFLSSLRPSLPRRIALEIAVTASSWPMTLFWSSDSRLFNLSASLSVIFLTGIPVHLARTSAISSTQSVPVKPPLSGSVFDFSLARRAFSVSSCSLYCCAASNSIASDAAFLDFSSSAILSSSSFCAFESA